MVRIFLDNAAQTKILDKLVFTFSQVQRYASAPDRLVDSFQTVTAFAIGLPTHTMLLCQPGTTCFQHQLVGNNKCRIKTDPELADQIGILGLVTGQAFKEFFRTGLGNGTDIICHFLAVHADTIICQGNGPGVFVIINGNL